MKWMGTKRLLKNIAKIHACMMQSSSTFLFLTFECINPFNSNPFLLFMFYMIHVECLRIDILLL